MADNKQDRRIFLSSVTGEFGPHRKLLKGDLDVPGVKVVEQTDFIDGGGTLLEKLDKYIRHCDVVIQLVGDQAGHAAKPAELRWLQDEYPDFVERFPFLAEQLAADQPTLSYTQMEAWLALYHRRRCYWYQSQAWDALSPGERSPAQHEHWTRLEEQGQDRGTFNDPQHLCRRVLRALHDLFPELPTTRRPIWLPYQSLGTLFKGRDKFLEDLRASLRAASDGRATAITGKAVHGLGGVGKTRLAVEFAWQHAEDYTAVLFVTADSADNLRRELAELTGPLVLDLPEHAAMEEEVRVAAALRWLQEHPGWFLILDNVDTEAAASHVEQLLARLTGGQVLITSRLASWGGLVTPLELDVLEAAEAASFLLERTAPQTSGRGRKPQPRDEQDAAALATELDGLALALEQAGAYIAMQRITLAEYRTRWQAHDARVQDWHREREMKYPRSVAATWETTLQQLGPDEIALLNLLAWFAPEPLPESVLTQDISEEDTEDTETIEAGGLRGLLAALADFGMIHWDAAAETVTVHRVVQEILRTTQAEPTATLAKALRLLKAAIPSGDPGDVRNWPAWEPLRPHVAAAAAEGDRLQIAAPTSSLLGQLGVLLWAKALHKDAEEVERKALAIDERHFGAESTEVALRLSNLAATLRSTNQLAEAEPLMRRALTIDEQCLGAEHPRLAIRLNNLAQVLKATNRLAEAEPFLRRVLEIFEKNDPENQPNYGASLNNLARLLQDTNRLTEAEPLFRRALAIDEQIYGADHPEVARGLNNLATLLKDTNRLAKAEPLMRQAVEILTASFGEEHPTTITVMENYRWLREAMGESG